jgi:phosphoribosyl 1,2-cyclic phosphodiesterase
LLILVQIFVRKCCAKSAQDLDAVLFTHGHKDHVAGLDDIRPFNYLLNKTIDVYAEEMVQEILKKNLVMRLKSSNIQARRKLI